jgi:molecular chaperone DnaJ
MAGQGEVGPRGGSEGDLYVEVIELPHPTYQRAGDNDLRCTITLSRAEAWQGTTVIVDDIVDGPFPVVVPPGTEPGNGVIVYGRGMPQLGAPGTRGALNVHLDIN